MMTRQPLQNNGRQMNRGRWLLLLVFSATAIGLAWFSLQMGAKMPNFEQFAAGSERKAEFFNFVRPLIESENERVWRDRERLIAIEADSTPGFFDRRWLKRIANDYGVKAANPADATLIKSLLLRVDTVPLSLALAQSAKESGWGTSRFARDGNNLFGEWCFVRGCGLVPIARPEGRSHEVEVFRSPRHSVASYLNNINTHDSYLAFRTERAALRAANVTLSGVALAGKLSQYSERRDAYVEEIQQLIRINNLESLTSNDKPWM